MMSFNDFDHMMGGGAGVFMWLTYLLFLIVLVLAAVALWKYITRK